MPRKKAIPRPIAVLFDLAEKIGAANVWITYAEVGALLTGDDQHAMGAASVYNRIARDGLPVDIHHLSGSPRVRMSSVLAVIDGASQKKLSPAMARAEA